jgi:Family of unknown function (DUF6572)
MSVEQTNIVDFVSVNEKNVILTISDHLGWEAERQHLSLLQDKINTYCRFIESDEIFQKFPESRGKKPLISIVAFYDPPASGLRFLHAAKAAIENEGYAFEYKKYEGGDEILTQP